MKEKLGVADLRKILDYNRTFRCKDFCLFKLNLDMVG